MLSPIFGNKPEKILRTLNRFLEAASVAEKWRQLRPEERSLISHIGRAFLAQKKLLLRHLRPYFAEARRANLREAMIDDWNQAFDEAANGTFDLFFEPIEGAIFVALLAGARDVISFVGSSISFTLRHPRAEAYMAEHGAGLITQINEVTRGNILTILNEGVREGWSYDRIARSISNMYSEMAVGRPQQHIDSRAHLIAVTELGNAYEQGSAIVARELQDGGMPMEKAWLTVGDNRVSDGCRDNEAQGWIPLIATFASGHDRPLRFPGCRCTALYRRARS